MKLFPFLLTGSLLANAILAGVVYGRWWSYVSGAVETTIPTAPKSAPKSASALSPTAGIDPETWQQLNASQPADLAARLRDKGYPPALIRAIVHAHVRELFSARYKALADQAAAVPYWRGSAFGFSADPKISRARRALDREVSELATQLLGPSAGELSETERRLLRRQYGDLSPEKVAEMQRITADYADLMSEVRSESRGVMLPEDARKLAFLENEKRADLARLLTPEELENIDLRSSRTAGQLRSALAAFDPTEEEFRAMFRIQHAFDTHYGTADLTPEQRARRAQAQKELAAQFEAALGPERHAEYKRTTDPAWQTAHRFVEQMRLPAATTAQLVAVQREFSQRVTAIRTDGNLTPQQQQAQVAALAQEANARLQPVLGDRGLAAYKQNIGYWLQALQVTPAPRR